MADFDLVIIGGGPSGYVAAIYAAQKGIKTALVEKQGGIGGTCLNVGCIPSKALLHASELLHMIQNEGKDWGIKSSEVEVDFSSMMKKKDEIVKKLTGGIDYLLKKNKVERIIGTAMFKDKETLLVGETKITAKHFMIATGSESMVLPFLPIDEERILTSTGALSLKHVPKKLLIIGGGVIGLELGSFYARLGAEVEVIEFLDRIIAEYDEDISSVFQRILEKQGLTFHLGAKVVAGKKVDEGVLLTVETKNGTKDFFSDHVLVAIGRKAFTQGLALENAGVLVDKKGFIEVDGYFKTSQPHIFAVGDAIGGAMLAHKGSAEGVCAVDIILGHETNMKYGAIPGVIYTTPEVATVGVSENRLKEKKIPYKVVKFPFAANSRYVATGGTDPCFVKYLVCEETKRLFGASIIAPHAGEMIGEPTLAITAGLTLDLLAKTIHAHPTLLEALHETALGSLGHFHHI